MSLQLSLRICAPLLLAASVTTAQIPPPSQSDPLASLRQAINTGQPDKALKEIADLRTQHAPDAVSLKGLDRLEGLALYSKSDLRNAEAAFAEALQKDPADTEAAQMRGLTLYGLGRPAAAIPFLESSRSSPLTKADPNYVLALCYIDTRRYDDARHAFAAQYGFAPDGAPAYLIAARMLLRREYLPIAQTFADKSLELDPSLPLAHELLGEIALAGNHLDVAIPEFEKELTRNPVEGLVYDRLGDAYVRAARYDDAQRVLQEALLLEPNSTGPYILLGKTMLKRSDPMAAATYLEHANRLDSANFMTHSLLGQAYRAMGRQEEAAREADIAQKLQGAAEPKLEGVK